jgi:hypothetical protein
MEKPCCVSAFHFTPNEQFAITHFFGVRPKIVGENVPRLVRRTWLNRARLVREAETELHVAVGETYRDVLNLVGNSSQAVAGEAHLGLARIHYHR